MSMDRGVFLSIIGMTAGKPYQWGGESMQYGFDCSGLVRYGLMHAGFNIPDMSANDMCHKYFHLCKIMPELAKPGDLYFYGKTADKINHVMIVFSVWQDRKKMLIGARGGNSETLSLDDAWNNRAYVDIVRGDYWKENLQIVVDPFMRKSL